MIRSSIVCLVLLATLPLAGQDTTDPTHAYLEEFLPYCPEPPTVQERDFPGPMPDGMSADVMVLKSDDPYCGGMYLKAVKGDRVFVGQPWILSEYKGTTEQRISRFAWDRMEESAVAKVSDKKTPEGLFETSVELTTSWGKIRLTGASDPAGNVFFPGGFDPIDGSARKARLEVIADVLKDVPYKGNGESRVELIEFSDFQCPSCRMASEWIPKVLDTYGDRISYRRIDFPLMSAHPWAFPAALYGRAIWDQSHEAFWQYKAEVYQNQSSLTTFTIEEFARDFVETNQLDVAAFDEAIASQELKDEILAGVGAGMIAEVNATPTFWVNGQPVAAGPEGRHLIEVLDAAIEQTSAR